MQLAFGFDGGLDSSGVLVWVEVQGRHHRWVFGVKGLRIGRELKVLSCRFLKIKTMRCEWEKGTGITAALRHSCPRNSDTNAILEVLQEGEKGVSAVQSSHPAVILSLTRQVSYALRY